MKILYLHMLVLLIFLLNSCTVKPKPINYGVDHCHYCNMTVVDKIHAAEIVTKKGKVYTFDSAECMIHFLKEFDEQEVKFYLSNAFTEPGKLLDATSATFLISENIPSPMGAFLTAFITKNEAVKMQSEKGGTLYTWSEIRNYLN
ncbi:nitrous oxide reductase accessory protein NosL [Gaetbulibacter aestuarii]|uniref:Nitrous oxide reductase accessory protein NosL n=1 Tax=Gaetbulibacter aestuarii TaxID=1502358 RepID=A0ABW7N3R7_9FLAO